MGSRDFKGDDVYAHGDWCVCEETKGGLLHAMIAGVIVALGWD